MRRLSISARVAVEVRSSLPLAAATGVSCSTVSRSPCGLQSVAGTYPASRTTGSDGIECGGRQNGRNGRSRLAELSNVDGGHEAKPLLAVSTNPAALAARQATRSGTCSRASSRAGWCSLEKLRAFSALSTTARGRALLSQLSVVSPSRGFRPTLALSGRQLVVGIDQAIEAGSECQSCRSGRFPWIVRGVKAERAYPSPQRHLARIWSTHFRLAVGFGDSLEQI
jgi:hypothetical protein